MAIPNTHLPTRMRQYMHMLCWRIHSVFFSFTSVWNSCEHTYPISWFCAACHLWVWYSAWNSLEIQLGKWNSYGLQVQPTMHGLERTCVRKSHKRQHDHSNYNVYYICVRRLRRRLCVAWRMTRLHLNGVYGVCLSVGDVVRAYSEYIAMRNSVTLTVLLSISRTMRTKKPGRIVLLRKRRHSVPLCNTSAVIRLWTLRLRERIHICVSCPCTLLVSTCASVCYMANSVLTWQRVRFNWPHIAVHKWC